MTTPGDSEMPVGGADPCSPNLLRGPTRSRRPPSRPARRWCSTQGWCSDGMLVFDAAELDRAAASHSVPAVVQGALGASRWCAAVLPGSPAGGEARLHRRVTTFSSPTRPRCVRRRSRRARLRRRRASLSRSSTPRTELRVSRTAASRMLLLSSSAPPCLVLGGTFAATGLAAAEGRPDRATLAASGATGRVQRLLVAGQAAFVSGLGVTGRDAHRTGPSAWSGVSRHRSNARPVAGNRVGAR